MSYQGTANEDVILDVNSKEIDLTELISTYQSIKQDYKDLPKKKETPDQETLDHYNSMIDDLYLKGLTDIIVRADNLYQVLKLIRDAGLLPKKYDTKYLEFEDFLNNL